MKIFTIDLDFLGTQETIACFLIEVDGELALVETGPDSTFSHLSEKIVALGYRLEDIQKVFVTHIHFDHAGAAWRFAALGAQIYVHPTGARHLAQPEKLYRSAQRIYLDDMERLWGNMKPIEPEQLTSVEDNQEVAIGNKVLRAIHTPGHAIHHIAWLLDDILFCGDAAGVKINDGPVVPPCPPPDIDVEAWMNSIEKIKSCAANRLYLTHFGVIEDKQMHLQALVKILQDWKNWMYPYAVEGAPESEVVELFKLNCQEYYLGQGLTQEAIVQYEHANPAFMSVAGLLRYWKTIGLASG